MPEPLEPAALPDRGGGTTAVVVAKPGAGEVAANATLGERTAQALDALAASARKITNYEVLFSRIVTEIGRFADVARRERSQLEEEVKSLKQELSTLRQTQAATEQRLLNSQLDCWTLQIRVQAMKDARTMFEGMQGEEKQRPWEGRVIDVD